MYVNRPVAFDNINFLPGFPSDSVYQCDPWSTTRNAGGCVDGPSVVGREAGTQNAGAFIQRALAEVTGRKAPALSGCGCGGSCGGCGDGHRHDNPNTILAGIGDYGFPDLDTVTGDPLGYLRANAFPIVLGALAVYLIKKR